jgi:DNA-binding transcriptional LysR family regulator
MQMSDRIGRRIKLQDVHVLMAVVQAGSMGKAARHLNTSQPNISKSIADLEHALGVRLLDRHRQGVEPTEYGRALLDCGTAVFDDLRQGVKNIEFLADPATGEARIGGNPFLTANFAAAVVDRLSRRYPRMMFHLYHGQTEPLFAKLTDRNLDLVITWKFGAIDERLEFELLFNDSPYLVVAGARSPWARRRRIELAELVNEPWALPPPDISTGPLVVDAFRASGLAYPSTAMVVGLVEARMRLLASGRFLTMFPPSVLRFSTGYPRCKVLPVELPSESAPVSVGIVTLKNRTLSPVARRFIEHAREVAKRPAKKRNSAMSGSAE